MEKEFIYKHSRTVFDLLDEDGSNNVSIEEFKTIGFLFNFNKTIVKDLFKEFDVSGDQVTRYYIPTNSLSCLVCHLSHLLIFLSDCLCLICLCL